jgi:type I restriction enzyme S subunit
MVVSLDYKQSEIGVIPEGWDVSLLSCLTAIPIQNGVFNEPARKGRGCKIINVVDLYSAVPIDLSNVERFNATKDEIVKFGVAHGDLFFTRSSLTTDGIAYCNIYRQATDDKIVFDCHIIRVRVNSLKLDPFFIVRYCTSRPARRYFIANAKTTTMTTVDQGVIAKLPVPVPPISEQRAIAAALSDIDGLLNVIDQLIAKKRNLKQAAMQQLLTGQTRLPGFSGDWEVKRLGDITHIKTGSRNNEDKVNDGQYPFFVRSETVERINSYSHECEAILVPGEGRIGEIFHYINGRFDVHQRVYAITKFGEGISGKFVHLYLTKNFGAWAMRNTVKATVDSLRLPTFQIFEMRLPPSKAEQDAIATVLSDMDAELTALLVRRNKTAQIKQGMMQELLTGRIRLV